MCNIVKLFDQLCTTNNFNNLSIQEAINTWSLMFTGNYKIKD